MLKPIIQFLLILLSFSNLYSQNPDEAKLNKILSIDLYPNYNKAQKALSNVNKRIRK